MYDFTSFIVNELAVFMAVTAVQLKNCDDYAVFSLTRTNDSATFGTKTALVNVVHDMAAVVVVADQDVVERNQGCSFVIVKERKKVFVGACELGTDEDTG